ncbi:MAG TPA: calcium-binding protein, partial [Moraxellaceae bacterium]|nr:calcium-binding protein [Moraxellaceae bacterium]
AGINVLKGGAGNDTYFVGKGDSVVEQSGEGVDTIQADCDWTLGANVENLVLQAAALKATGNALANRLTGNDRDNTIDGGTGADVMVGGAGNDQYWIDNSGDIVLEWAGEGIDTVFSSVSVSMLAPNVENVTLTGKSRINATGNDLANVLTGNDAANVLAGGLGDDVYIVGAKDSVVERLGEGRDRVISSVSWTLADNVEDLDLVGTQRLTGTGNALANRLRGNSAANTLSGGAGNDTYLFGRGGGADIVIDSDSTPGNIDTLLLDAGIAYDQLWLRKAGGDLEISVIGTSDKVTVGNWYAGGAASYVERIQVADGQYLTDLRVDTLVQAMAGMTAPGQGQLQLSPDQHQQLDVVLAATWQAA